MALTYEILKDFEQLTKKDITVFFERTVLFFNTHYKTIVKYFSGDISEISSVPFQEFDSLYKENRAIFEVFQAHSRSMNNTKWWDLIQQLEDIDSRFNTLRNINKWSRSSLTKVAYSPNIKVEHILNQNETLENVAEKIARSTSLDEWANIAIDNRLEEEDYSLQGGTLVDVYIPTANNNITVNAVVDVIQGKSIYGKDVNRQIKIVTDDDGYNDLDILNYDNTLIQAVEILSGLRRRHNPDAPNDGLQSTAIIGVSRAVLNFPIINRQLSETFATDDSLKNFQITNIAIDQDTLIVDYSVQTRLNETITQQTAL